MILQWKGIGFTPATLNDYMRNNRIYQQGYLTPWNTATLVNGNVRFDARLIKQGEDDKVFGTYLGTIVSGNQIVQKVDEYLQRGIPVMLNVDITPHNAYNSSDTHWVVAVSRYNNDYLVNDPAEQNSGVISLQQKYGRSNQVLADAIVQAILYS
ncbi:MAG: C39 family peptidase, partial [Chloroflexota bacterium]